MDFTDYKRAHMEHWLKSSTRKIRGDFNLAVNSITVYYLFFIIGFNNVKIYRFDSLW
jgi:hypothetical protein